MRRLLFISIFALFFIYLPFAARAQVLNSQSFDSTTFPPAGWTVAVDVGSINWARYTATIYPSGYSPHSGPGMAGYDSYSQYPPGFARLVTPSFDLSGRGSNPDSVVFWFFRGNYYSANDSMGVYVNTSTSLTGAAWLGNILVYNGSSPAWYRFAYSVPASYNGATNYIIFRASADWWNDIFLDDVQWTAYPLVPPPVPTLVRPANHSIGRPLYDTLQWTASAGATNYNMQIALDSLFTTMVFNDTTLTATGYIVGQFSPLTNWWWRVRAKNAAGWSAFTIQWTFKTMGPATVVTLLTPANNSVNQPTNLGFVWSKASDQTSPFRLSIHWASLNKGSEQESPLLISNYWFALYTDTTQSPYLVDSTLTDTTKTVNGLSNNTNYWWKVKAKNQVGWGSFSGYFKFTTIVTAPAPPTLIAPANNSTYQSLTPTMDWSSVASATSYRIQISADSTFTTTVLDSVTTRDSLIVPSGRLILWNWYYWHVRSQNIGGNSSYTAAWRFQPGLVGITPNGKEIPKVFKLYNNYPNPFNPNSIIKFDIPKQSDVKLVIYSILGQEVEMLVNGHYEAGAYSVTWDGSNYPSGVYFYKITAGDYVEVKKMVLLK